MIFAALLLACLRVDAFEPVTIDGDVPLKAHWQPAAQSGRRPAIIALHGCSGLYGRGGRIGKRYSRYAAHWNASGWHVIAPDSFGSRGSGAICTLTAAQRTIKVADRRGDVLRTAQWLAARTDVDAERIAIVGWSNGGSTALESLDLRWQVGPCALPAKIDSGSLAARCARSPTVAPAAIVAYYPSCAVWRRRSILESTPPLLMLLGEADDWTPAAPCKELAERMQRQQPGSVEMQSYEGAHHGFDGLSEVRLWSDVPSGINRSGVHVGGNVAAREASLSELDRFLVRHLRQ
ncbi:MAG: dienelactone hydrolase family protein [Burkholderiaceae bacterium]